MEEVYTCECGNQQWIIYGSYIKCNKCTQCYYLWPESPAAFNKTKEVQEIPKTCQSN